MTCETLTTAQRLSSLHTPSRPLAPVVKDMDNPAWQSLADRFYRVEALPETRDPVGNGGYTHGLADAVRREHRRRRDAEMRAVARAQREMLERGVA